MQRDAVMEDLFGKSGLALNIFRGEVFPSYCNPETGDIEFKMDRNFMLRPDDPSMINNYWRNYNGEECGEQTQLGQMWLVDHINKNIKMSSSSFLFACPLLYGKAMVNLMAEA